MLIQIMSIARISSGFQMDVEKIITQEGKILVESDFLHLAELPKDIFNPQHLEGQFASYNNATQCIKSHSDDPKKLLEQKVDEVEEDLAD